MACRYVHLGHQKMLLVAGTIWVVHHVMIDMRMVRLRRTVMMMLVVLVVIDVANMHIVAHWPNSRMQREWLLTLPDEIRKTLHILAFSNSLSLKGLWLAQLIKDIFLIIFSIFIYISVSFFIFSRCITQIQSQIFGTLLWFSTRFRLSLRQTILQWW